MTERTNARHLWLMVLCCLIPMAAIGAIYALRVPAGRVLTYAMVLLCPLSHLLMMRAMGHRHAEGPGTDHSCDPGGPQAIEGSPRPTRGA